MALPQVLTVESELYFAAENIRMGLKGVAYMHILGDASSAIRSISSQTYGCIVLQPRIASGDDLPEQVEAQILEYGRMNKGQVSYHATAYVIEMARQEGSRNKDTTILVSGAISLDTILLEGLREFLQERRIEYIDLKGAAAFDRLILKIHQAIR